MKYFDLDSAELPVLQITYNHMNNHGCRLQGTGKDPNVVNAADVLPTMKMACMLVLPTNHRMKMLVNVKAGETFSLGL